MMKSSYVRVVAGLVENVQEKQNLYLQLSPDPSVSILILLLEILIEGSTLLTKFDVHPTLLSEHELTGHATGSEL
jgi:hypothetical protein